MSTVGWTKGEVEAYEAGYADGLRRVQPVVKASKPAKLEAMVLDAMMELHSIDRERFYPTSEVRARVRMKAIDVIEALRALAISGKVSRGLSGRGWRLVVTP